MASLAATIPSTMRHVCRSTRHRRNLYPASRPAPPLRLRILAPPACRSTPTNLRADGCPRVRRMGGREPLEFEELVRENENLREQRGPSGRSSGGRAAAGLEPMLDEIVGPPGAVEVTTLSCTSRRATSWSSSRRPATPCGVRVFPVKHPQPLDRTTVVGRAALDGEAVQIPDVLADPDYSFGARRRRLPALLGVPIVLDDD